MYKLKQIIRSLWRYKSFTVINFLGLSIGIAAIVILYLIAAYEKTFDRLHSDNSKIYRVVSQKEREGKLAEQATVPYPTAKYFRNEYKSAIATQINFAEDADVKIDTKPPFKEKNIVYGDSLFFKVMDYASIKNFWISGNSDKALDGPNKGVLTVSTAKRYFGNENPIGKTFRIDNKADIEVVGIVKDIPPRTHLPVSMFISFATMTKEFTAGIDLDNWNFTSNGYCYIKIDDENSKNQVEQALNAVVQKNAKTERDKKEKFSLQAIPDIHFDTRYDESSTNYTVSRQYLLMLMLLGGFIILIACVNYINLSTSFAFTKSKEVGIRKTIGASKAQLFFHYLAETIFITTVAAIIGVIAAVLFLPTVNQVLNKSINADQLLHFKFIAVAIAAVLFISFISGAYPALILSGFKPILSLKNQFITPGRGSAFLRKALVIFQFTTSIVLIICTIGIARQVKYFRDKSLGFNKDAVIEALLPDNDSAKIESMKARLQNQPGISSVSFCLGAPISGNNINTSLKAPELPEATEYSIKVLPADVNFLKTYGLNLIAGRWLLPGDEKNLGTSIIVNETLVKTLGYKTPAEALGKKITIGINDMSPSIVGVVKDFHTNSLHQPITSIGLTPFPYFYYAACVRIDPGNIRNSLSKIETAFRNVYANDVYQYNFIDETLAERYEQETRDYKLFKTFSAISIFICAIGLWGLIAFVVVRKTKEIGIRKVLGASVSNIIGILSKDFLRLVLIGLLIASPVAWYFMNKWLQEFAYRIHMSWWIFLLAGAFALMIAIITISFQAIKAALANPVKSLRTE